MLEWKLGVIVSAVHSLSCSCRNQFIVCQGAACGWRDRLNIPNRQCLDDHVRFGGQLPETKTGYDKWTHVRLKTFTSKDCLLNVSWVFGLWCCDVADIVRECIFDAEVFERREVIFQVWWCYSICLSANLLIMAIPQYLVRQTASKSVPPIVLSPARSDCFSASPTVPATLGIELIHRNFEPAVDKKQVMDWYDPELMVGVPVVEDCSWWGATCCLWLAGWGRHHMTWTQKHLMENMFDDLYSFSNVFVDLYKSSNVFDDL